MGGALRFLLVHKKHGQDARATLRTAIQAFDDGIRVRTIDTVARRYQPHPGGLSPPPSPITNSVGFKLTRSETRDVWGNFASITFEATTRECRKLGQWLLFDDGYEVWGPLAVTDGKLLVRDVTRLVCFDIAAGREEYQP